MKTTTTNPQSQNNSMAILAFDISKERLNLAASVAGRLSDHEFANRTPVMESR